MKFIASLQCLKACSFDSLSQVLSLLCCLCKEVLQIVDEQRCRKQDQSEMENYFLLERGLACAAICEPTYVKVTCCKSNNQ